MTTTRSWLSCNLTYSRCLMNRQQPDATRQPTRTVTVNRRDRVAWHADMTVRELLDQQNFTFPHIIVTINGSITPHDAYDRTVIPEGADVRVIHLMAGG